MSEQPFERTSCACPECRAHCSRQPGALMPGDAEAIAGFLGIEPEALDRELVAGDGALALDKRTGRLFRIGTITPRRESLGNRCVFLLADGRCRIHPVAPAGCRFFDAHMSAEEGQARSVVVHLLIRGSAEYQAHRRRLQERDGGA